MISLMRYRIDFPNIVTIRRPADKAIPSSKPRCAYARSHAKSWVWGANEQHDFRTDAAAATVLKSIECEPERIVAGLLRKLGGN